MKVLVIGNGFTRHEVPKKYFVNVHTADFLVGLAKGGHKVSIGQPLVVMGSEAGLNNALLPNNDVQVVALDKSSILAMWAAFVALLRADFVYIFFPGTWPRLFGRLCRLLSKPYALYVRGEKFGNEGIDAALLTGAVALLTETGLESRVSNHNKRYIPIAPMIDMTESDQVHRQFHAEPLRPLRVLFVGRLEAAKGIPELVEAAGILRERGVDYNLRLVGGGPLFDSLVERQSDSTDPHVNLVGLVSDKARMMKEYEWADVLVLPSHHEGFPRVLFEAMIKSCVIVTTMVGGIPALMKDRENCISVKIGDSKGLADALELLSKDTNLRQTLSDAGRNTVLNILRTRPAHIDAVKEVLNECV